MFIVPLGVVWAGYTLVWYGFSMIKGPGMGFTDLIFPSRVAKAEQVMGGWAAPTAPASATQQPSGTVGNGPGVQPGSSYYPPNPSGGLPSKPPLGSTPPAGYS